MFALSALVMALAVPAPAAHAPDMTTADLFDLFNVEWSEVFQDRHAVWANPSFATGGISTNDRPFPPAYLPLSSSGMIILDDRFLAAIRTEFPADAATLNAFLIAHEIGHHAQALRAAAGAPTSLDSVERELQADCYGGAILARINRHSSRAPFDLEALFRLLPRFLEVLKAVDRRVEDPTPSGRGSHGFDDERVSAIRKGATAADPTVCET